MAEKTACSKTSESAVSKSIRRGTMPPTVLSTKLSGHAKHSEASMHQPTFAVHVGDDPKSIEECLSVSGKAKAIQRLRALLPNHFAPKLDVSMWLSPPVQENATASKNASLPTNVTVEALQDVLDEVVTAYRQTNAGTSDKDNHKRYRCTIAPIGEIFVHPQNGRTACIYQIEYSYESSTIEENGAPFPKNVAKELHKSFCDSIVRCVDGTEIR